MNRGEQKHQPNQESGEEGGGLHAAWGGWNQVSKYPLFLWGGTGHSPGILESYPQYSKQATP